MATITFHPTSDITLGHSCSTGSTGWNLLGSNDGDSTYINGRCNSSDTKTYTSNFGFSGAFGKTVIVKSIAIYVVGRTLSTNSKDTKNYSINLSINGTAGTAKSGTLDSSYTTYSNTYTQSLPSNPITDISQLNLNLQITNSGKQESSKTDAFNNYFTEAYIVVTYEESTIPSYNCAAIAGANIDNASVSSSTVLDGESVTFTAVVSQHCTFDGWYTSASGGTPVSGSDSYTAIIHDHTTLYARAYKNTYSFALGAQPRAGRGTATLNKSTAQYPDTVTFTCTPASSEYTFYGWFSDPQGINLVSTDATFTTSATQSLTLYPKVDRLVSKSLSITYGQGKTYLTGKNATIDFNLLYQAISCLYNSSSYDGTATFNADAMSALYSNDTAKPVKMDVHVKCGRQGSISAPLTDDDYLQFRVDGVSIALFRPNSAQNVSYTLNSRTHSAIINSTRSSVIDLYHHTSKKNGTGRAVGFNSVDITTYFIGYKNQVFIAPNSPSVMSVSVDKEVSAEYDTVVFSAELAKGATWVGWYSDSSCTNLISTNLQYSATSVEDLTLYAKATGSPVYTCSAVAGEHITGVRVENSKVVSGNTIQFTVLGTDEHYEFDGWYSDAADPSPISTLTSYSHTVTEDTVLYAKAIATVYNVTVLQGESGFASATPQSGIYNSTVQLKWVPNDEWYEFDHWQDTTNKKQLSTNNPYTYTITNNVSIQAVVKEIPKIYVSPVAGEGIASVSVNKEYAKPGEQVVVSAVVSEDYEFDGWYSDSGYGTLLSKDEVFTYTINSSLTTSQEVKVYAKAKSVLIYIHVVAENTPENPIADRIWGYWIDESMIADGMSYELYDAAYSGDPSQLPAGSCSRFSEVSNNGTSLLSLEFPLHPQKDEQKVAALFAHSIQENKTLIAKLKATSPEEASFDLSPVGGKCLAITGDQYIGHLQRTDNTCYIAWENENKCFCSVEVDGGAKVWAPSELKQDADDGLCCVFVNSGYELIGAFLDEDGTIPLTKFGDYGKNETDYKFSTPSSEDGSPTSITIYVKTKKVFEDTGVFVKINGTQRQAIKVYKKIDGIYVEQADMQSILSYLQNNNIRSML